MAAASRSVALALAAALVAGAAPVAAQGSHASHHPPGGLEPVGADAPHPGAAPSADAPAAGGGMGDMMGAGQDEWSEPLVPSLLAPSRPTPERRRALRAAATAHTVAGLRSMREGTDALRLALRANDPASVGDAADTIAAGLDRARSGVAIERALAGGRDPHAVGLEWGRAELALPTHAVEDPSRGFHFVVIALLGSFVVALAWMHLGRIRRATELLHALSTGAPAAAAAARQVPSVGARFEGELLVSSVIDETHDIRTIGLVDPAGGPIPFRFEPGQFVRVEVEVDGTKLRRSYSIASSPGMSDVIELGVKREPNGVVSKTLCDRVKAGDRLLVSGPFGRFTFSGDAPAVVLVAGGIGITPLLSVLRYLTDRGWPRPIHLLQAVKTPADLAYADEIALRARRYPNLFVRQIVERVPEGLGWHGPTGYVTEELLASIPDLKTARVHLCGPPGMTTAIVPMLRALGVPGENVRTEDFAPATPPPAGASAAPGTSVTFLQSKKTLPLPGDRTVLDVADAAGVAIDSSCRVGTCGACRVRLVSGKVEMACDSGLSPEDRAAGYVLACQAKATAPVVVDA